MLDPEAVVITATVAQASVELQIETRDAQFRARLVSGQDHELGAKKGCSGKASLAVRNGKEVAPLHEDHIGTRNCGDTLKQTEFLCGNCAMSRGLIW